MGCYINNQWCHPIISGVILTLSVVVSSVVSSYNQWCHPIISGVILTLSVVVSSVVSS